MSVITCFLVSEGFSQTYTDYANIMTYNHSLAISVNSSSNENFVLSTYGAILNVNASGDNQNRYFFQSQEYDEDLNLILFPRRFYSLVSKRFMQTDPASQYNSPYTFVGGDPVNHIDLDGNIGKPLVLFQEDSREASLIDASMADLMEDIPNAHYVPMSDFVNGEVGALPEWNGSVFLKGHSTNVKGKEIITEELHKGDVSKTKSMDAKRFRSADSDGHELMVMDSKEFGRKLRVLADREGVEVKSIISGSCEGSIGAEGIGKGFADKKLFGKSGKRPLKLGGLKKKKYSFFGGRRQTTDARVDGFRSSRFYVGEDHSGAFEDVARRGPGDAKYQLDGLKSAKANKGASPELPYADTPEIEEMYNGRIPTAHANDMKMFDFTY